MRSSTSSIRLFSGGFLLLIIWTDSGLVKHGGEHDSLKDCQEQWAGIVECMKKEVDRAKKENKACGGVQCGQPVGFCLQGERLTAPGVIFPLPEKEATCD